MSDLASKLAFAESIAREAGALTLEWFGSPDLAARTKADGSPVTQADGRSEELLRERIRARYPADGILGEEGEAVAGASGDTWILDPIDGTVAFMHGVPLYSVLVALERDGDVALGVCHLPALDETVAAARGLGATWRPAGGEAPRPARVSTAARLADAVVCTTLVAGWDGTPFAAGWKRLTGAAGQVRGWSDAYGLALVATGRAEIVAEPLMSTWDNAPFAVIVEEAGGTFTDLAGERTIRGGCALATSGGVFEEALAALRG